VKLFGHIKRTIDRGDNTMKTTIQKLVITFLITCGLSIVSPAYAFNFPKFSMPRFGVKNDVQNATHSAKQEIIQEHKEDVRNKIASTSPMMKPARFWGFIAMANGKVTVKDGTTITITKDTKTYSIQTDDKTQFRRLFWGKSSFDEIQVGDTIQVFGKWTDEAKTIILARSIRDVSIQKRFGVFFGVVQSLTSNGWVMTTISTKRDNQTVTINTSTKLTNRKGETISQADIVVGHRVRVKGMWDRANNTVTEVTIVRDFSLPTLPVTVTPSVPSVTATPILTVSVTPTVTPVPTATPVPTDTPTPTTAP
jgi:hypothetical protein